MSKNKKPIIYHGMFRNREDLLEMAPQVPPDATVYFAWAVNQGTVNGPIQHLTYWCSRQKRIFNVTGVRYSKDGVWTSWEYCEREIKRDRLDATFSKLLKEVKDLPNVKNAKPIMEDMFMRMLADAEKWRFEAREIADEPVASEDIPFRGKVKLGGVGIEEPREN